MDWTALRDEFPVTQRWAFLDHAAVAPISARARKAFAEWSADLAENGLVHESRWTTRVEEVRRLFGRLLHCDPLDLAFVKNTSEGIGIVAEGLRWRPGDNMVTAAEEYPSNLYPWLNLDERGVEVRRVASRGPRISTDDIAAAIDSRTRLLSLSMVEYASGFRTNLDALGGLCRDRGILFFADAIQGLGALPLDLERTPVDFLAADGHKWLLGPEGAGILYVRRERLDQLRTIGVGWNSVVGARDFSRIELRLKPHAGRWESGSLNVAGIHGLGASLELLLEIGIEAIAERIAELTEYLCVMAEKQGITVFSSRLPGERSGIVSLAPPFPVSRRLLRSCREEGVVVNERAGRLRVSPHCYNSRQDIDRLMDILRTRGVE